MKTIKNILLVTLLFVTITTQADLYEQPAGGGFRSTSSMMQSGSSLPMAAQTGTYSTYDTELPTLGGRINASMEDPFDPFGGEEVGTDKPLEPGSPVGEVPVLMFAVLLLAYAIVKYKRHAYMNQHLSVVALLLTCSVVCSAAPAKPGYMTMTQPDGTTVEIELRGDEYYHYAVNRQGDVMEQDANGYWRVVEKTLSSQQIQSRRASSPMMQGKSAATQKNGARTVAGTHRTTLPTKGLVILVNFQDVQFQSGNTQAAFSAMMNDANYNYDGATGSAKEYFRAQSGGQYVPEFEVVGPVTVSQNQAYYGTGSGAGKDKAAEMVMEACKLVENQVDFTQYRKTYGSTIDFVYVIFAGHQENESGGENTIWAHNWNVASAYTQRLNGLDPSAAGNKVDGLQIGDYACSSELSGASGTTRSGIGTFVHEFSHVLGLPDLYDTDGTTNGNAAGLDPGNWSPLAYGNYLNGGKTPCNYSIYDKYFLGWVTPECLSSDGSYSLNAGEGYQFNATGTLKSWNYTDWAYYVENRQKTGWDAYIPASGMLLWKVNYLSGNWTGNLVNAFSAGVRCSIIPADGTITSRGDAGDVYTEGTKEVISGYNMTNIAMADGKVKFCLNSCSERFTVRWMVNGALLTSESYDNETALVLPAAPESCDANRVFRGWTAQANYLDPFNAPADLFTTAEDKIVTADVTYYAVFGPAQGE